MYLVPIQDKVGTEDESHEGVIIFTSCAVRNIMKIALDGHLGDFAVNRTKQQ